MRARCLPSSFMAVAMGLAIFAVQGCASSPVEPYEGTQPATGTIYVAQAAWHTEIALPVGEITGPLANLAKGYTGAQYLAFGWGSRDYYMSPHPGSGDLLAASMPGPAVMLVIPVRGALAEGLGADTQVYEVPAPPDGIAKLSSYLWEYFAKDPQGHAQPIASGPYPGSSFYQAGGTYDLFTTCNTFTAQGLEVAGVPVDASGVVRASQVTDQVAPLARRR